MPDNCLFQNHIQHKPVTEYKDKSVRAELANSLRQERTCGEVSVLPLKIKETKKHPAMKHRCKQPKVFFRKQLQPRETPLEQSLLSAFNRTSSNRGLTHSRYILKSRNDKIRTSWKVFLQPALPLLKNRHTHRTSIRPVLEAIEPTTLHTTGIEQIPLLA